MLSEIDRLLRTGQVHRRGVMVWPERWSLGIVATALLLTLYVLHRSIGRIVLVLGEISRRLAASTRTG